MALGAGAFRLARQFLTETVVLSLAAGAAGVGLAFVGLRTLVALAPSDVPRLNAVTLDLRVLAVTVGMCVAVGLIFGLVPVLQALRVDPLAAFRGEGGRHGTAGRGRSRVRSVLVVAELALAVVLLAGAGLLIKSFWRLQQVDAGFTPEGVLKAEYQLPVPRYPRDFKQWPNFKEVHAFNDALLRRAAALPGVDAVAISGMHPLDPGFTNSFVIVGREAEAKDWPEISTRSVTPGYFRTVGLKLHRGRLLSDSDTTSGTAVAVINEATAQKFFQNRDPIGAQIGFWGTARTIVGVVGNERFHGLAEAPPIAVYTPLTQTPAHSGVLLIKASNPAALTAAARSTIREVDPALAVFAVEPLNETVRRSVSQRRFTMLILGIFAALALTLAAVGVHGVLSYGVLQRTREIGIRMALGARPGSVLRLIVGQGVVLAAIGVALGIAGALALTRVLTTLLFGVTPTDSSTLALVVLILIGSAVLASYLPARRAMRVDPSVALRVE
jgi:putative ABC transport system permease protein